MAGVILTTHGNLASGLYSTVKMIAGEFKNIRIVEFHDGDDLESFDERIARAYKDLNYDRVVVICDLAGGTPFNRSVMTLSNEENVQFLAGANFAMLYQALSSDMENMDEYIDDVLETSRDSIVKFKNIKDKNDDLEGI